MRILLLGEYSGAHSSLSKALIEEGNDVTFIHNGDGYKKFKADFYIDYKRISVKNKFFNKLISLYYIMLGVLGIKGIFQIFRYKDLLLTLKNYDIVQIINPIFIMDYGVLVNLYIYKYLKKKNKKIFLCALGDDYFWVKNSLEKKYKYSMFDRLNIKSFKYYLPQMQWIYNPIYKYINTYMAKSSNAVVPGLYDYYVAYKEFENCSEIVPIIVYPTNNLPLYNIKYPINIFHGWQFGKEFRKGNDIFDEVLKNISEKYSDIVNYQIVGGLSYEEYIKSFNDSHIFIDQCFSYDAGVNGLLGMSAGKAVFSGMESETLQYYTLDYKPLVNAIPEKKYLYDILECMILNPKEIEIFSRNGMRFISEYHSPKYVLEKYRKIWSSY